MTLKTQVQGTGTEVAEVEGEALITTVVPYPPLNVENKIIPFVGSFTVNGDESTINLNVDGSVVPIDAFIGPPIIGDLYLTTANILIADSGVIALNRFGGISGGLTIGIDFFIENANERILFAPNLKTNFDFIRIGTLTQGIGGKNDAYQMANATPANEDAYNPVLDLETVSPGGVRLRKDTLDKIGLTINDDLTSVSTFQVTIFGYIRT